MEGEHPLVIKGEMVRELLPYACRAVQVVEEGPLQVVAETANSRKIAKGHTLRVLHVLSESNQRTSEVVQFPVQVANEQRVTERVQLYAEACSEYQEEVEVRSPVSP